MKRRSCLLLAVGLLFVIPVRNAAQAQVPVPGYMGSETCSGCHQVAAKAWKVSHHAWAWGKPNENSVLGDFANKSFEHKGIVSRFTRSGGKFYISTDGFDGKQQKFEVVGTVGVTPLQQYLVETESGRLQVPDLAWNTDRGR